MDKIGHRYVIQYFYLKGLSPSGSKSALDSTLGESAPSYAMIKNWVAQFKRGRTSCEDEHRTGQQNEVTTPETFKKIHKIILDDRRLKVRELADIVGLSKSAIHRILTENLDMKKLSARWVPRLLTIDHKQHRADVSMNCLAMFTKKIKTKFLRRFITMDEKWVHHYTLETKQQSKQWTSRGEPASKKAKTTLSAGKVMASVFLDARGKTRKSSKTVDIEKKFVLQ
ncbi:uncharacterized protein LOC129608102 [Condylostylus longicornis]|uniref:uncharacterized protein LOC129608102 n=1 Tax=Condylostylus longicornis TaxID=2530218 RepID=UPI00244DEC38|nr:uncharacterized protein LOC129608102 [Condylostylus longicornis]